MGILETCLYVYLAGVVGFGGYGIYIGKDSPYPVVPVALVQAAVWPVVVGAVAVDITKDALKELDKKENEK